MIADYIDEVIMICAGLWMAGVGFGYLSDPFQARPGQPTGWWTNFGAHFRWMGPLLIVIAVVLAVAQPR